MVVKCEAGMASHTERTLSSVERGLVATVRPKTQEEKCWQSSSPSGAAIAVAQANTIPTRGVELVAEQATLELELDLTRAVTRLHAVR